MRKLKPSRIKQTITPLISIGLFLWFNSSIEKVLHLVVAVFGNSKFVLLGFCGLVALFLMGTLGSIFNIPSIKMFIWNHRRNRFFKGLISFFPALYTKPMWVKWYQPRESVYFICPHCYNRNPQHHCGQ